METPNQSTDFYTQYPMTDIEFLYPSHIKNNFGIYNFTVPEQDPIFKTVNWVINVDISGSMTGMCKDGQTKMEQIKHTLKNMIKYFQELKTEKKINQYITLIAFDDQTKMISYNEEINEAYVKKFNEALIYQFEPTGMTDIGSAIDVASNIINEIKAIQQTNKMIETPIKTTHIFLTDGEITKGEIEPEKLKNKITIDDNISNIFIGFGTDHSGTLLEHLSDTKNSEYYFIESLEKAGMVYGEIIYNSLYEAVRNFKLKIENGKIYNYKTNTWVQIIDVGNIPYGAKKTWHIETNDENTWWKYTSEQNQIKVMASYDSISQKGVEYDQPTTYAEYPDINTINKNVEKYKWRQQTLELIAETKQFIKLHKGNQQLQTLNRYHISDSQFYEENYNCAQYFENSASTPREELIIKLDKFMLSLKTYIEENDLQEDTFMKNITDDIYVSIHSIDSTKGYLYISARQKSQGSQRSYNITNYEELINPNFKDSNNLSLYTQSYETSSTSTTSYSSQQTVGLMQIINTHK